VKAKFELSEQDYRYLFENASDAMWVHDMEGNILDGNEAFEKLTGYTLEEWARMNMKQFLTEEFLDLARRLKRKLLNGEAIQQPYEQRLLRKDGAVRIMKMATSPVIINGKVRGFQHVARDVTEEKDAEEMLSKIIDGSPIPSFVINKQHKVTHWNTTIASLTGIAAEEIVGTDEQWRAFYTEKRPVMADLIVDGASAAEVEAYYRGKYRKSRLIDGAYEAEDFFPALGEGGKWLLFNASPIKDKDGQIISAIETLQDITEERRLEENMRYYVQLITRAQEEERKRISRELHDEVAPSLLLLTQRLDAINSSTKPKLPSSFKERMEDLRNLTIEALESLRRCAQDLRPRILDDLGLIPALEWVTEELVKNYGINARVEVEGTEQTLPIDIQLLLFRIAQEAFSNIRKHAGASMAVVKLEFGDDNINMTVSDNGRGFELPPRVEDLASAGKLGIIGMCERARLLRGSLEIKSELGKGTHVVAKIPFISA
jgi:PAS domain S-box-containing protein